MSTQLQPIRSHGLDFLKILATYGITRRNVIVSFLVSCVVVFLIARNSSLISSAVPYAVTFLLYPSLVIIFETETMKKLFRNRICSALANYSFGIYLWHSPLIVSMYVVMRILSFGLNFNKLTNMLYFAILCTVVAAISYHFIEIPLSKIIDCELKKLRKRKKQCSVY